MSSVPLKKTWLLFLSLYTTQYIGVGFLLVALVSILRQQGADLSELSFVYVVGIPWILKFAWSPLVDRFGFKQWGHYRSWLLILQLIMVVTLLVLSQLSLDNQLTYIVVIGVFFVTVSATQDIAVDALATHEFDSSKRGFINGIQLAGGLFGNVIGGGITLMLYPKIGWQGAFYLMAFFTSLSWIQLWFFKESDRPRIKKNTSLKQIFAHFYTFWKGKKLWFLLVFSSSMAYSMIYAILNPMMVDSGKTLYEIGFALNVVGSGIGVVSGVLSGFIIQKVTRNVALKSSLIFQPICFLAIFIAVLHISDLNLFLILIAYFITYPLIAAIMSSIMMDYASKNNTPGTDYTIQFTVSFFSGMLFAGIGMHLAGMYGYLYVIGIAIMLSILSLILAYIHISKHKPLI